MNNCSLDTKYIKEGIVDLGQLPENIVLIKKYSNRKLYDTSKSCYVTLDEVAEDIRNNVEIIVIDNKTHQDITNTTYLKYIMDKILEKIEKEPDYVEKNTMKKLLLKIDEDSLENILTNFN